MLTLLFTTALLVPLPRIEEPNVANRTQAVRVALEKHLKKKAADITFADLATVTELTLPHIHPKSGTLKDDDFAGLSNLKKLEMYSLFHNEGGSEEPIAISGKVFRNLSKLEELSIVDDELGRLPDDVFAGLTSLRILDLSDATLTRLPRSLLSLPKIEAVYYSGRKMKKEDFVTLKNKLGEKLKKSRPRPDLGCRHEPRTPRACPHREELADFRPSLMSRLA